MIAMAIGECRGKTRKPKTCHEMVDTLQRSAPETITAELAEKLLTEMLEIRTEFPDFSVDRTMTKAYYRVADRYAEKVIRDRNLHKF